MGQEFEQYESVASAGTRCPHLLPEGGLTPCPFCGGESRIAVERRCPGFFGTCDNCGTLGPVRSTRLEAARCWCRRNGEWPTPEGAIGQELVRRYGM